MKKDWLTIRKGIVVLGKSFAWLMDLVFNFVGLRLLVTMLGYRKEENL